MNYEYVYTKSRAEFGRACNFSTEGPKILFDVLPDKNKQSNYILKDPVHRGSQKSSVMAEHEINTEAAVCANHGMSHTEGSWPREINPLDPEQTTRYRRKVEKDEKFIRVMKVLCQEAERVIKQNNTVNIYSEYFDDDASNEPLTFEKPSCNTTGAFRDRVKPHRAVSCIVWSHKETFFAASYLPSKGYNSTHQEQPNVKHETYIWDPEYGTKPVVTLYSESPIAALDLNVKEPDDVVGGMTNGRVCQWDIRVGEGDPAMISGEYASHEDAVTSVRVVVSKSGQEFFSASCDGEVMWWDYRNLSHPIEKLVLDPVKGEQDHNRALGASCLEYDSSIPTRFFVGCQNGMVIGCNRKVKTPADMIISSYQSHVGPVYAVQRNPTYPKNFLTVGDWSTRIWSEDCKSSAIMWSRYQNAFLSHGCWSPTHFSVFFTTRSDGILDIWDIMADIKHPCLKYKVSDHRLTWVSPEPEGRLLAVGDGAGVAYVLRLGDSLVEVDKKHKALFAALLERENHGEKLLDQRIREIRLKQRKANTASDDHIVENEKGLEVFEKTFFETVKQEIGHLEGEDASTTTEWTTDESDD